jgi:hypothetical protein
MSMTDDCYVITMGINDAGCHLSVQSVMKSIGSIVDQAHAAGLHVVVGEMPNPDNLPEIDAANMLIRERYGKKA